MATCPGLCPIAKETAKAAPTLCTECGSNLLLLLRVMDKNHRAIITETKGIDYDYTKNSVDV